MLKYNYEFPWATGKQVQKAGETDVPFEKEHIFIPIVRKFSRVSLANILIFKLFINFLYVTIS